MTHAYHHPKRSRECGHPASSAVAEVLRVRAAFPRAALPLALLPLVGLAVIGLPHVARAATPLTTRTVASGLTRPVYVTAPVGDTQRLFIVEQRAADLLARVKIVKNGVLLAQPFITIGPVSTGNEQGLLGMAFAPDYATSRRFYLHYTDAGGTTRLARYTTSIANPDSANPTGQIIYSVTQPFSNHNGGWIAFGPDGYLYMALGDGGSANDPGDRAQNLNVPLGKILRFDVSGTGNAVAAPGNPFEGATPGLDEIWSFGLRNPWRCSFDARTGDLTIGDVGQNAWEEIDFVSSADGAGKGANFGWRCYEGNTVFLGSTTTPCGSCTAPGCSFVFPAYVYPHTLSRCSVTGGYVYRGCAIPDLQGTYFFADYCGSQIYTGRFSGGLLTGVVNRQIELDPPGTPAINSITSFGEDANGELYICDQSGGEVFQIVAAAPVLEADMPILRVPVATGDTLGCTSPGNGLAPGITPFVDPGSRIRGVGFLRQAQLRGCTVVDPQTLTATLRLPPFDVDVQATVDPGTSTLTRTLVFTNTAATAQPLVFVDVLAPFLSGNPDQVRAYTNATSTSTARLAQSEASNPDRWIVHQGFATGASFGFDADSAATLQARVAADLPLANRPAGGPARVAMALQFDFGSLAPAVAETVVVVTRVEIAEPVGLGPDGDPSAGPDLRVTGPQPFRDELTVALALPRGGRVRLDVYDVRGRRVRQLLDEALSAGSRTIRWDGRDDHGRAAGAGIYFLRLHTPEGEQTLRVVRVQ